MTDPSLPILYSFRRCPYAIRARLALRYAGLQVEIREVVLRDKPEAMLTLSPKGTVPVLVLEQGRAESEIIEESLEVMLWALAQNDPDGWLDIDMQEAISLIDANDDQFKPWLDRYKYPDRFDGHEPGEALGHCENFLQQIEQRLQQRAFICGDKASLVDMAMYSFVRQFAFVDIDWFSSSPYQQLNKWLDDFLASDLFTESMQKYPPWHEGDQVTVF
ncbi:MAG: glutathione S-transferase [Gammaproteobacteria bacterium]